MHELASLTSSNTVAVKQFVMASDTSEHLSVITPLKERSEDLSQSNTVSVSEYTQLVLNSPVIQIETEAF